MCLQDSDDGLTGGEGMFLACSFWLVDHYTSLANKPRQPNYSKRRAPATRGLNRADRHRCSGNTSCPTAEVKLDMTARLSIRTAASTSAP